MANTIQLKRKTSAGAAPPSTLLQGEIVINTGDGLIYYGDTNGDRQPLSDTYSVKAGNTSLTTVGALGAGSIATGFGAINNGSSAITTSGTMTFGSLADSGESITVTKFVDESDGIGSNDNDTSIPTSAAVKDYVDNNSGGLSGLGSTDNAVLRANGSGGNAAQGSGVTIDDNGYVIASKVKTGALEDSASTNGSISFSSGFGSDDTINVHVGGAIRFAFVENSGTRAFVPWNDNDVNLGHADYEFKNLYLDGTAHIDTLDVDGNAGVIGNLTLTGNGDFNGDLDVDGTTNLDVVDIDGAVDMATTLTLGGNADFNGDLDVSGTVSVAGEIQHTGDSNTSIAFATDSQTFETGGTTRLDIANNGLRIGGTGARVTEIEDNDSLGTSDTKLCTQGNVKAYVDANAGGGGGTVNTADIADVSVTQTELAELETIGSTTISSTQWGYVGGANQALTTSDNASFERLQVTGTGAIDLNNGYMQVKGNESTDGRIMIFADEGDNDDDKWEVQATTTGLFEINAKESGDYVNMMSLTNQGQMTLGQINQQNGRYQIVSGSSVLNGTSGDIQIFTQWQSDFSGQITATAFTTVTVTGGIITNVQ